MASVVADHVFLISWKHWRTGPKHYRIWTRHSVSWLYRKAFDSIPHRRLMKNWRVLKSMVNCYSGWRVPLHQEQWGLCWGETFLQILAVLSGFPQGSVLEPLLFLLFVNELPSWIISDMKMFADDTRVWCRIKTETDSITLQEDLDRLYLWSNTW